MELWQDVKKVCAELVNQGWDAFLYEHGLDISKEEKALQDELRRPLLNARQQSTIQRTAEGFEDFHHEGVCAIEPGCPAKSLLYHALASPKVPLPRDNNNPDRYAHSNIRFWIETIENYVYGVEPLTWDDLFSRANGKSLAIVVFAYDYRPAALTPHHCYADLCFSRTGISRVGTTTAQYDPQARAFLPFKLSEPKKIPLLPARYGAFLAVLEQGSADFLGKNYLLKGDDEFDFWVPLHKLFAGKDCLNTEEPLTLDFKAHHVNEKLRRFHIVMQERKYKTGWTEPFLSASPFIFTKGIARQKPFCCPDAALDSPEPANPADNCNSILVVPQRHDFLVEAAAYPLEINPSPTEMIQGENAVKYVQKFLGVGVSASENAQGKDTPQIKPLTYFLPENYVTFFREDDLEHRVNINVFANLHVDEQDITGAGLLRSAPEVVHARKQIEPHERDLHLLPNVMGLVAAGGYEAQHYLDYTGDGWVQVTCPQIQDRVWASLAAYSLVAPPDFLPSVNQRQVMDWWSFALPFPLRNQMTLWEEPPFALADARHAPNLTLSDAHFSHKDKTATAVVTVPVASNGMKPIFSQAPRPRTSFLPDGASGIFAPGWDISLDVTKENVIFLAGYGGGSPFLEDSVSCAALSSFWPAAAPDTARIYPSNKSNFRATVAPLMDSEIGRNGGTAWDGQVPPQRHLLDGKNWVKYTSMENADYVAAALKEDFSIGKLAEISVEEYTCRVLAMAQVYAALGANLLASNRKQMLRDIGVPVVLSFRWNDPQNPQDKAELASIQSQFTITLPEKMYRWEVYLPGEMRTCPDDLCFRLVEILSMMIFYTAGTQTFWREEQETAWYRKFGII